MGKKTIKKDKKEQNTQEYKRFCNEIANCKQKYRNIADKTLKSDKYSIKYSNNHEVREYEIELLGYHSGDEGYSKEIEDSVNEYINENYSDKLDSIETRGSYDENKFAIVRIKNES